jgi:hypothetical protein
MRDPERFKRHAEECKRLASKMPEHEESLLAMAQAWQEVAEELERSGSKPKGVARNGSR